MPIKKWTKNYLYVWMLNTFLANRKRVDDETGRFATVKMLNGGGSRAGKTYDIIHLIVFILSEYKFGKNPRKLLVMVYRNQLKDAREKTMTDFLRCFREIGLIRDVDFKAVGDKNGLPSIELWGHDIRFNGMPDDPDTQPLGCDISYINELIENNDERFTWGISRRTELLFLADWNPSKTVSWAYDLGRQFNVFYSHTTYLDNVHIPLNLLTDLESKCPWEFTDYEIVIEDGGFKRRKWLKPERPENCKEKDYHLYRTPNRVNVERGTVNKSEWLTYGEGLKGAQEGAVFSDLEVNWIEEIPYNEISMYGLGLDLGYKSDPSVLTFAGFNHTKNYSKKLFYQKTETPEILFEGLREILEAEEKRRQIEADWLFDENGKLIRKGLDYPPILIHCESQDNFKDVLFVPALNELADKNGYEWEFVKVRKPHIIMRTTYMKKFTLHFVSDDDFKREQENYVYLKDGEGKPMNTPDPASKFCDIFDSLGYAFWGMKTFGMLHDFDYMDE